MLKITAEKSKILSALSKAQSIVDKKTIMQIINNVYLYTKDNHLFFEATDLELFFKTKIPVKVISEGEITITPRKLYEIIKEIPKDEITLEELENYWLKIHVDEKAQYTLAGISSEEFPKFRPFPEDNLITIKSKIIKDLIERTIFSVSIDDRKFALSGILLEVERQDSGITNIRMVSSDGHRLNLMEYELEDINFQQDEKIYAIILKKGANEIKKFADESETISFNCDDKFFYVKSNDNELIIRLIEGTFPDYKSIIPEEKIRSFYFPRKELIAALKRVSILIPDPSFKGVKLHVEENSIMIESLDKKIGQAREYVDISYSGESFDLALNARYLIEALNVMKSESVEFAYNDEESPCIITGEEDKGFLGLIMPMSLEE